MITIQPVRCLVTLEHNSVESEYEVFAEDLKQARDIVRFLYKLEHKGSGVVRVKSRYVHPSGLIVKELDNLLSGLEDLKGVVSQLSKIGFYNLFITSHGWGLTIGDESSFWFRLLNYECKAVLIGDTCYLNTDEILIHHKGTFILREGVEGYLIGVLNGTNQ